MLFIAFGNPKSFPMDRPLSEMDGFSEHQIHLFVHKELSLPEKPVAMVIHGMISRTNSHAQVLGR